MAKEEKKKDGEGEKRASKKHLHRVMTDEAGDGSLVHHHIWKKSKDDTATEPPRMNAATSSTPDEAGQHVADMFAQNQSQQGDEAAQAPDPVAAAPAAGMPA